MNTSTLKIIVTHPNGKVQEYEKPGHMNNMLMAWGWETKRFQAAKSNYEMGFHLK